jgi:hypothetical protein
MPVGGTTGQVLAKNSATDYDTEWVDQSVSGVIPIASGGTGGSTAAEARTNLAVVPGTHVQAWDSALDSIAGLPLDKGNLIAATGTVWDRIPAGADGQILMANSASPVGLQWNDGGSFSLYFSQTGGTSVTNTITETTLFSATAVGSRTVPAAKLVIGDVYRVRAAGFFNSPASTPGNATHRLRINGTQVLSTGAQAIPTSAANNMFTIECSILIRTLGGSGTVGANLVVALAATSTSLQPRLWSTSGPVTIDMSSSVTFDLTVEMSSALTTNLWQGAQGTVERVRVTALP